MTDPFAVPTEAPKEPLAPNGTFVAVAGLKGRLLLIKPKALEKDIPSKFKDPKTNEIKNQHRLTADVTVLDGSETFTWADVEGDIQTVSVDSIPHTFEDMFISQARIIDATEDARDPSQPNVTMTLGRLGKDGRAWRLYAPETKDVAAARQYVLDTAQAKAAAAATASTSASPFG